MRAPTYERLGYKRLIVDYHFSSFVPGTLKNANAADYVAMCTSLGVDSVLVYAKDHWGHCYFATDEFPRHPNVSQDLFGEILAGLRAWDIVGYAYISIGWDEHAVRTKPGWAMRDETGDLIRRGAAADDRVTGRWQYICLNSPYRTYVLAQIRALIARYDFPALFLDILFLNPAGRVCHCDACKNLWARAHSTPLPTTFTQEYVAFAIEASAQFQREVKSLITQSGKDIWITHNFGLPYEHDDYVAFEVNPLGRNYVRDSALTKIMRAEANGREIELIGHRFNMDWDFTTKSKTLMRWEAATVAAHNGALMWVDQPLTDGSFDPSAIAAMRDSFRVTDAIVPHVRGSTPYAEIALLYPALDTRLHPDDELDFVGAYKWLSELHFPFDVIGDQQLTRESLKRFRLVIVARAQHLAPNAIAALTNYVREGGHLIFTHQTSLPNLVRIEQPVVHPASFIRPNIELESTYLRVNETVWFQPQTQFETRAIHVEPNIAVTFEQWISHNVAPGEITQRPAIVTGTFGTGKYIYAGARLFAEFARQELNALRELLIALVNHVYVPTIWVDAPRIVEATFNQRGDELIVCLVNGLVNRPTLGGVLILRDEPGHIVPDEIIPISNVRVHVKNRFVHAATDAHENSLTISGDETENVVTLNRLDEFAVIKLVCQ